MWSWAILKRTFPKKNSVHILKKRKSELSRDKVTFGMLYFLPIPDI